MKLRALLSPFPTLVKTAENLGMGVLDAGFWFGFLLYNSLRE